MMVLNKIILTWHDTAKVLSKDRDHSKFIPLSMGSLVHCMHC